MKFLEPPPEPEAVWTMLEPAQIHELTQDTEGGRSWQATVVGDFLEPSVLAVRAEHVHDQRDPLDDSRPMRLAVVEIVVDSCDGGRAGDDGYFVFQAVGHEDRPFVG
nr:hypothetical protein [Mycolicibacterium stellerae]